MCLFMFMFVPQPPAHRDDSANVRASPFTIYKRSVAIFRAIEYKAYCDCCVPFYFWERLLEGYKTLPKDVSPDPRDPSATN